MKILTIMVGILTTIVGVVFLAMPELTFLSIGWVFGLVLLVAGISLVVDYASLRRLNFLSPMDLGLGILTGLVGALMLLDQPLRLFTDLAAVYMLGAWMTAYGIIRLVTAIRLRKAIPRAWVWLLILGILMVALGIYSFFHPTVSLFALTWLIAFYVILGGVDLITLGVSMKKIDTPTGERWVAEL